MNEDDPRDPRRRPRINWPWMMPPSVVRVLLYADFVAFSPAGQFQGLGHVIRTLESNPYFWVRFHLTRANRFADDGADLTNVTLDQLDLINQYDELWLFGGQEDAPDVRLTPAEISAVTAFMARGGGVLITGDHADLGSAIGSRVPRAGKLRNWNAPDSVEVGRLSTLRHGHTPGFDPLKQSDDVPQELRLRTYPLTGSPWWRHPTVVHPVMDSPLGPIDVFPDHGHEGEVVLPSDFPTTEWPADGPYQPKPEIVAWGRVVDPSLTHVGQEFGVVAAYDGQRVGYGRVVADSSWHHWFDVNLVGQAGTDTHGFYTPCGFPVLLKIDSYYLNVGMWLAPQSLQVAMRNRLFWGAMWRDPLVMLPANVPAPVLGETALEALSRYVSRSTLVHWTWELLPNGAWANVHPKLGSAPSPPLLEECLLGAAVGPLVAWVRSARTFPPAVNEGQLTAKLNGIFDGAVKVGLAASRALACDALRAAVELE